jgi:hypothetical protein
MNTSITDSRAESPKRFRINAWLIGSAAGAAASAEAATVQIDLIGNTASFSAKTLDDNTYGDLTGDGIDDLVGGAGLNFSTNSGGPGIRGVVAGVRVGAFFTTSTSSTFVANVGLNGSSGGNPASVRDFVPVTFTDARINGGAPTNGFIEVFARNISESSHEIQLVRLIFDDENTALQEKPALVVEYSPWTDLSIQSQPITTKAKGNAAKLRLKRQIAALEALIRKIRPNARDNARRLNFLETTPSTLRYLMTLERRLNALKQQLRRL